MQKKPTSLIWFVVGILVYISILGFVAQVIKDVLFGTQQTDTIIFVILGIIINIIVTFAAGSYASWRYELPSSPMRVALITAVTSFVLSTILAITNALLLTGSLGGVSIVGIYLLRTIFSYKFILSGLIGAVVTGTILFLTLTYFSTKRSQAISS